MASFWYSNNFSFEGWFWQARRILAQSGSDLHLTEREAFNRLASGYATRTESLSLFGSYPLNEAQQLVDGLFGTPYDRAEVEASYADRSLSLHNHSSCRSEHGSQRRVDPRQLQVRPSPSAVQGVMS